MKKSKLLVVINTENIWKQTVWRAKLDETVVTSTNIQLLWFYSSWVLCVFGSFLLWCFRFLAFGLWFFLFFGSSVLWVIHFFGSLGLWSFESLDLQVFFVFFILCFFVSSVFVSLCLCFFVSLGLVSGIWILCFSVSILFNTLVFMSVGHGCLVLCILCILWFLCVFGLLYGCMVLWIFGFLIFWFLVLWFLLFWIFCSLGFGHDCFEVKNTHRLFCNRPR